jgi:hypothetical protein
MPDGELHHGIDDAAFRRVWIVRPSPAIRAGDNRLRAASTDRTQGKPASRQH